MSSFIVSQECMNNIINGIYWDHKFKGMFGSSVLKKRGLDHESEDYQMLGDDLFNLNALAVGTRYSNEQELQTIYKFMWKDAHPNKFQVLKSLHCLHYQCSEDNADDTDLYKWLTELIQRYTDYIIYDLPEYDKATWD